MARHNQLPFWWTCRRRDFPAADDRPRPENYSETESGSADLATMSELQRSERSATDFL